jgi:hypothetical protein
VAQSIERMAKASSPLESKGVNHAE